MKKIKEVEKSQYYMMGLKKSNLFSRTAAPIQSTSCKEIILRNDAGNGKTEIEKGAPMLFGALSLYSTYILHRRAERGACYQCHSLPHARHTLRLTACGGFMTSVCFCSPAARARMTKIMPCLRSLAALSGPFARENRVCAVLLKSGAFFSSLSKLLVQMYF